tara:strand:- start:1764 stop:1973 length:210 start_codon:yes stop_codon:yes gene_type:complete
MSKKGKYSKQSKNYNELRAFTKKILKQKTVPDESEQLFVDDPRAVNEIEYGRVIKKSTYVFQKNILSDL